MKRKLDLRSGRPVWFAYRSPAVPVMTLTCDVRCDVLVIGMGISAAMIAQALAADGHKVICVDRRGPMMGSTPATTALVQYEIDQPLSVLSAKIGRQKAEQAWRRSRLAVANLAATVEHLGIECGMVRRPSLYLAGNVLGPDAMREEGLARRSAGLASSYLDAGELSRRFGIERKGALLSANNLALDPRKLTSGLLNHATENGARFYAPVEAASMEDGTDGVTISTVAGPVIRADQVVLATGYELMDIVPKAKHSIISTWAIATKPQKRALWPQQAFVWEASDPYLYMRITGDGRIICGGEDEDFSDTEKRDALIGEKTRKIEEKLQTMFPGVDAHAEFSWAGAFGTTATGLPYIDAIPRHPRIHAVMGYGGNGITFSRIASEIIASRLAGRQDTDEGLFAFD